MEVGSQISCVMLLPGSLSLMILRISKLRSMSLGSRVCASFRRERSNLASANHRKLY